MDRELFIEKVKNIINVLNVQYPEVVDKIDITTENKDNIFKALFRNEEFTYGIVINENIGFLTILSNRIQSILVSTIIEDIDIENLETTGLTLVFRQEINNITTLSLTALAKGNTT